MTEPNTLWVADFSYLRCWEGLVFFSFVIDAFSRRVVGWQLSSNMRTTLVLDALRMALGTRQHGADVQLVHHSDAGWQYTSFDYTQTLNDHRVLGSIGTIGDAFDNALAESFVDSFKTELIADRVWRTRSQLELAVVEYIAWFNNDRLHSALGYRSPAEHEQLYARRYETLAGTPMKTGNHLNPLSVEVRPSHTAPATDLATCAIRRPRQERRVSGRPSSLPLTRAAGAGR